MAFDIAVGKPLEQMLAQDSNLEIGLMVDSIHEARTDEIHNPLAQMLRSADLAP